jgi:CRISPR-associated protein (Cas_Csy4)
MSDLNEGAGICRPTHQLSIRPTKTVLELGALDDVLHSLLNATHHANRHGAADDRVALALPDMHVRRGVARPGTEIVLFGSNAALEAVMRLDGVLTLVRRGMVRPFEIVEVDASTGENGTAFIRNRQTARRSPGAIRRARERAARRGKQISDVIESRAPESRVLALHFGAAVVHVDVVLAQVTDVPIRVSTYGFSSREAPAVLPILLNIMALAYDDAA